MEKQTFSVPKISCGHCVMSIKNELTRLDGVHQVDGDPGTKTVTVQWDSPASVEGIKTRLNEIGYPAA